MNLNDETQSELAGQDRQAEQPTPLIDVLSNARVLCQHIIAQYELGEVMHKNSVVMLARLTEYDINEQLNKP